MPKFGYVLPSTASTRMAAKRIASTYGSRWTQDRFGRENGLVQCNTHRLQYAN
jgi:hypothetical protein